ncbi:MAG TPA: hypothetical protein VFW34_02710 [Candidatus Rubrimentiphilum sp.]|nr:hypothetical protein [Candidatus Rubrimentiphilum sp.]
MFRKIIAASLVSLFTCSAPAFAWGDKGHEIIGQLAGSSLPSAVPAFMRTMPAQYEIMYLAPEFDRLKGSGTAWDAENDPGHYVDLDDNGMVAGVASLQKLPATREEYDTALRAAGTDQYRQGYLPYAIIEGWEQLRYDFGYWRVDNYHATHASTSHARAEAATDRAIDQALILRDAGVWGHFVEDACQPLHVTIHFNGWGNYPNPNGYTNARNTHSFFESTVVDRYITPGLVKQQMVPSMIQPPNKLLTQDQVATLVAGYIQGSWQAVGPLYDIEKTGGFANGSPAAVKFTARQLARGAVELRDLITLAWYDSLNTKVGYPYQSVRDILNGAPPPKGSSD